MKNLKMGLVVTLLFVLLVIIGGCDKQVKEQVIKPAEEQVTKPRPLKLIPCREGDKWGFVIEI